MDEKFNSNGALPQSDQTATPLSPAQTQSQYAYDPNQASAQQPSAQPVSAQDTRQSYAPPTGSPVQGTQASSTAQAANPAHAASTPYAATVNPVHASAAAAKPKDSSTGKTFLVAFAGALVACVLALGVCLGFGIIPTSKVTLGSTSAELVQGNEVEATLAESVANKCLPSVVSIDVYAQQQSNPFYDFLYGGSTDSGELTRAGLGSGVLLSDDGYIVTNWHVVEGGEKFKVTIEGEEYDADLVGSESTSDVAVLKVKDGKDFTPIALGDSDNITVGEWVMSLGSPFGLEQSVATGIVSATSRSQIVDTNQNTYGQSGEVTIYPNMIQTDAAINPGNSGGALVDSEGKLIGINTLITSYSGNYSGVGFAIPSNYAISLAQSIIAGEEPTYASLGITMTTVDSSIAERYGFAADSGAYVSSVTEGSAAANAGIKVGDIVTAFDGKEIASSSDLMLEVRTKKPGDTVTVTVNRDGEVMDLQATLGKSEQPQATTEQQNSSGDSGSNILDFFNR